MSVTATESLPKPAGIKPQPPRGDTRFRSALRNRSKLYLVLYLLLLPTIVGMVIFNYTPKWQEIVYSFFKWDGQFTLDYIGWDNYAAPVQWRRPAVLADLPTGGHPAGGEPGEDAAQHFRGHRPAPHQERALAVSLPCAVRRSHGDPRPGVAADLEELLRRQYRSAQWLPQRHGADARAELAGYGHACPGAASLQPAVDRVAIPVGGSVWGIFMLGAACS